VTVFSSGYHNHLGGVINPDLPYVTFGLNMHVSSATKVSPLEFAHSFPAKVPLTTGLSTSGDSSASYDPDAVLMVERIANQHQVTSDHMTAVQVTQAVRLSHLLQK